MATTQEMDSIPNTFAKRKFLLGASAVLAVGVVAGVGAKLLAGGSAGPFKANAINTGDTAWVLTTAALVMIMIPAVGFFYGAWCEAAMLLFLQSHCFLRGFLQEEEGKAMLFSILLTVLGIVCIAGVGRLIWHLVRGPDARRRKALVTLLIN